MFGFFERRLDPFPETRTDMPPARLWSFIWHYVQDARAWLILMAILSALIGVSEVLLFGFLGQIVDWLAASQPDTFFATYGWWLAGMVAVVVFAMPLGHFVWGLVVYQVMYGNLPMSARWRMHTYLLGQSMGFFSDEYAGRVGAKVMQTALAVREVMIKLLDVFVYTIVFFITMVVLVASADLRLAAPLALWLLVYIGLVAYFVPRLTKISEQQADARSAMTGRIVDSYTNIATVKLFAHAGGERSYARNSMREFLLTVFGQFRLVTAFYTLVHLNNAICVLAIGGLGIMFWTEGAVTVGAIAVALGLALRIVGMSQWVMWEVSALFENIGVVYDGMSMLSKRRAVEDAENATELTVTKSNIAFETVSFHYGKQSGVIEALDLEIAGGEKIGLVGRSGAGKSTLVNLLLRFYDVERGDILIDGQSVRDVTQSSLRRQIGMVTQDTSLLHRSIRENIKYGVPEATDEQVWAAIARADATEFIRALEDAQGCTGLDAQVGERGVKLSGGQRQRIAIARIFLKDAPILVLDEATSALDSEVEAAIQQNLFRLMQGKTVIAIAHRLSTIAAMDRLVVLDKGAITEMGTHDELLERGGLYADLWTRQSGGFLADTSAQAAAE
ncbi:MAG: ABC transporter ATP-binding protein [Henriciella sp.]|nr:ABC transporter ATP-binding protein/permease [Hyphomonadaceae bacterium]